MSLSRSLALSLAACAAALSACSSPTRSAVEIDYTFGGLSCRDAGVALIQIDVKGEALTPNQYTCAQADKGINIGRYLAGIYTVAIQGFDTAGFVTHKVTQDVRVEKVPLNVFQIDVPSVASGGSITLLWKFGGQTCAQAGVTAVRVALDGDFVGDENGNVDLPCRSSGVDGTTISGVEAGTWRVDLQAYKGSQLAYNLSNVTVEVDDGYDTELSPNLIPVSTSSASAYLVWTFAGMGCADAKVNTVRVAIDGGSPAEFPCSANGADAGLVTALSGGQHQFTVQGVRSTASGNVLAYQTAAPVTGSFSVGLTTQVLVNAAASSPGVGGAKLVWSFPAGGPVCTNTGSSTAIAYTLKSPTGQSTNGTSSCGGAGATQGIEFCNPTSAGCPAGSPGLAPGYWTIDATATGGATYKAQGVFFPVPNGEQATTTIAFVAQ